MVLDIVKVKEGHSTEEQRVVFQDNEWPRFLEEVRCRAEIDRIGARICLGVRYSTTVRLECARCLRAVTHQAQGSVRVQILDRSSGSVSRIDVDEEFDFIADSVKEPVVDIRPAIYDEIVTELPMKPLCSPSCSGIPLERGRGISVGNGGGRPTEDGDPRWDALKQLKDRMRR